MEHALLSQDGWQRGGFLEVVRHMMSPFDLSRTLLVGGGLLVSCSLLGPPVMEKAMAPHSSTLAWKIPWTEEPGGLQSMGSLGVGHD